MTLSKTQNELDYERIAKVIAYLQANARMQPDLEELANVANLSPFHFQKMFSRWAGTTPKKFLQYLSLDYAKTLLNHSKANLESIAEESGLSGSSRLHDLFIQMEAMSPATYRNQGDGMMIYYSMFSGRFGTYGVASTEKGICSLQFVKGEEEFTSTLRLHFSKARLIQETKPIHLQASGLIEGTPSNTPLAVHLKASPFQLKVWEALLKIPSGNLSTYGEIAKEIQNPKASRAVGTAIGSNPIAILIPCHRVIQNSGILGGYRWGMERKAALIGIEALNAE